MKPPPFRIQNGDAADPRIIAALAHVDITMGTLFSPLHRSGWWMLHHILSDGDVNNNPDRPRLAPCVHLVYDFVLHVKKEWQGHGWYMGWRLVRLLRAAYGCGDLVLSEFVGMSPSNRRAIAALAADHVYNPQGLCTYLGLPPGTCVLRLELMICSTWLAYGKCSTFDVNCATFTGTQALAEWISTHQNLFDPLPPASNGVWVDALAKAAAAPAMLYGAECLGIASTALN